MVRGRASVAHNWKLFLSLAFSMILLSSLIPPIFALDTFKVFAGNDSVMVPGSPELQLGQFTIEVRFRITVDPPERGYLVSKGAVANGSVLQDQNYALFLTKLRSVGGGFKSVDGSYNYIYSPPVSTGTWHVAKLNYNGNVLELSIDNAVVSSRSLGKLVDNRALGDLRIGANANGVTDMFYVGDIDYLEILDQSASATAYSIDFDGSTDPSPSDCSEIPMSELRGAVFLDPILAKKENGGTVLANWAAVNESMSYVASNGMNFIRVPYYWEAYVYNPVEFLDRLEVIAQAAADNDICVVFANFHWYTTSYWKLDVIGNSDGKGFPSFVVKGFPRVNDDYDATAAPFWDAFLSKKIFINGTNVWDVQSAFIKKVINKVDHYDSVSGYEILNEPHLFNKAMYDKLGNYHTYMAKEIREVSSKKIFFDRETARGFPRDASLEYKIVPQGVNGLVYEPHMYSVPTSGSQGEMQLDTFNKWSKDWGVEIMIGEWAADTQEGTSVFIEDFKDRGFGWTYYAWRPTTGRGSGNMLYESDSSSPTIYLEYVVNALQNFY